MKAAVLYGANDLRYEDVETPKCPEAVSYTHLTLPTN